MTIDPTKPMFDAEGREWVALRMPDGSVWEPRSGEFSAVHGDDMRWVSIISGQSPTGIVTLSNTKPQKDAVRTFMTWVDPEGEALVKIRLQRRNGVITAEVVNND